MQAASWLMISGMRAGIVWLTLPRVLIYKFDSMHPVFWKFRGSLVRLTSPLFFKRVGAGTQFTGRIRWPMPLRNVVIGKNGMIGHDVHFQTGRASHITIGDEVSLNSGCHVIASESIVIGDNVAVGEYVSIRDSEHRHTPETGVRDQGYTVKPIIIEDNCWIGRGVYIGPGSRIRKGSIIAANSIVRGEFPEGSLIAGAPAVVKRTLLGNEPTC